MNLHPFAVVVCRNSQVDRRTRTISHNPGIPMTLSPSPATRKLSIRFRVAAVLCGMVLTAAPLTTRDRSPSAPQTATTATNDETRIVAGVVAENTNMDGVKGKFVNRTRQHDHRSGRSSLRGKSVGRSPSLLGSSSPPNKDGTPLKMDRHQASTRVEARTALVLHDRFSNTPCRTSTG